MGLIAKYKNGKSRLILLDYDGTLVNYESLPEKARPSGPLLSILRRIADNPQNKLVIITGRGYNDIDKLLGNLPIDIIAEHGALIKENGEWTKQLVDKCLWKKSLIPLFNHYSTICPGSFVEEKTFALAWHYRNCISESTYKYSRELIGLLEEKVGDLNLKIFDGKMVIEIMTKKIGKGEAVKRIIGQRNYDYILSVGDDNTDEEMFAFLSDNKDAVTIKVGNGDTVAKYRIDDEKGVIKLLKQLSLCG